MRPVKDPSLVRLPTAAEAQERDLASHLRRALTAERQASSDRESNLALRAELERCHARLATAEPTHRHRAHEVHDELKRLTERALNLCRLVILPTTVELTIGRARDLFEDLKVELARHELRATDPTRRLFTDAERVEIRVLLDELLSAQDPASTAARALALRLGVNLTAEPFIDPKLNLRVGEQVVTADRNGRRQFTLTQVETDHSGNLQLTLIANNAVEVPVTARVFFTQTGGISTDELLQRLLRLSAGHHLPRPVHLGAQRAAARRALAGPHPR